MQVRHQAMMKCEITRFYEPNVYITTSIGPVQSAFLVVCLIVQHMAYSRSSWKDFY